MTTLASFPARVHALSRSRLTDFLDLAKPRVMALAVFTAFVGFVSAPAHIDPLHGAIAMFAIAVGAGAAGVLNMYYDGDIDALMERTVRRPIPAGRILRVEALCFGLSLACASVITLALAANVMAAALLALTISFYVVVYTIWLKRRTPKNIVIGGAAGALPPVVGWAASAGDIGLPPAVLFLIIFLWTPPHFWALSLDRVDEYARAGVPMLPVVAGRDATIQQILAYSVLLIPASLLPFVLGFGGTLYVATAVASGAILITLGLKLKRSDPMDRRPAHRLFAFSIAHLFLLFTALIVEHGDPSYFRSTSAFTSTVVAMGEV